MIDIDPNQIDQTVPATDPEVHRILGVDHYDDPAQSARRMALHGQVPHIRNGRRVRFSIPALQQWQAQKLAQSVAPEAA